MSASVLPAEWVRHGPQQVFQVAQEESVRSWLSQVATPGLEVLESCSPRDIVSLPQKVEGEVHRHWYVEKAGSAIAPIWESKLKLEFSSSF